ncbi:hypothetical protein G9A89_004039 [Geosiphon pyriformis]|nr:hypothetical protein G9A89_004039 [Geosiphon pyriformis]
MENLLNKRTPPETHDCNECEICQKSISNNDPSNKCRACQFIFFKKFYKDFSSGNKLVDEIIKNPIYIPPIDKKDKYGRVNYYNWIPWDRLKNISKIGEGGFGAIYKATWIDGRIDSTSIKHHGAMEYKRIKYIDGKEVAIKFVKTSLQNDEEVFKELNIERTMFIESGYMSAYISHLIGITQNPETFEYGTVMNFASGGDLRKYLRKNFHSTSWDVKLEIARAIAYGLKEMHSVGMIHRDLHSGNILQYDQSESSTTAIGDLGLCQTTNKEIINSGTKTAITTADNETLNSKTRTGGNKGIFGVIPYIPPEVLRGEEFTTAGDIYSFAMILWELATGMPPFHDFSHDQNLIIAILNGQRPNITSLLIPSCIAELIEKCWDINPSNRPTAEEVEKKLNKLQDLYLKPFGIESSEFLQFKESEKYIKKSTKDNHPTTKPFGGTIQRLKNYIKQDMKTKSLNESATTNIHPGAIYTSRLLTAQIVDFSTDSIYLPEDKSDQRSVFNF